MKQTNPAESRIAARGETGTPAFIPETERNEHVLAEVCASLRGAVRRHDARSAWCYLESARVIACVGASDQHVGKINDAAMIIEADLQNELWGMAARSVAGFERTVQSVVEAIRWSN